MKAIADHGARFVGCNVMFLEGGTRDHFMKWLAAERPELVDGYRNLYSRKYATSSYRKDVHAIFNSLRDKYGLNRRDDAQGAADEPVTVAEQQMLRWRD